MATLLTAFRDKISPFVPGCPLFTVDSYTRDAVIRFCRDTNILVKNFEEADFDYTTIDDTDNDSIEIDLTTYFTNYVPIEMLKLKIDGSDKTISKLELVNDQSDMSVLDSSLIYFNYPDTTTLKLFPFTSASENFDIYVEMAVRPAHTVTSVDDFIYNDWKEAICAYALYELQKMPKKSWTDVNSAILNLNIYQNYLGDARIGIATGFANNTSVMQGGYF
jgi:hypothetical protein